MKKIDITRVENSKRRQIQDFIIPEISLNLVIHSSTPFVLPCSGDHVNEMITGYLYTNGYIDTISDIRSLNYNMEERTALIDIEKNKTFQNGFKWSGSFKLDSNKILEYMEEFAGLSEKFKQTGAVHTAAMATQEGITRYFDDISRHNAIDKIIGYGLTHNELFEDKCLLLTCRMSGSILSKVIRAGFPMVVSTSPPTDHALEMARENNIAMAGFVRGGRMNIYNREDCFQ